MIKNWDKVQIPMLTLFGYTSEKVDMILNPMAQSAVEALGSMGNDAPLACLSRLPRNPFDYFYQLFAQATNPAIDPIREANVMSLECPIGPEGNLLNIGVQSCRNR
jgi:glutamate synthase (NADPH/NADH)